MIAGARRVMPPARILKASLVFWGFLALVIDLDASHAAQVRALLGFHDGHAPLPPLADP